MTKSIRSIVVKSLCENGASAKRTEVNLPNEGAAEGPPPLKLRTGNGVWPASPELQRGEGEFRRARAAKPRGNFFELSIVAGGLGFPPSAGQVEPR